jgi:hypothetical protein
MNYNKHIANVFFLFCVRIAQSETLLFRHRFDISTECDDTVSTLFRHRFDTVSTLGAAIPTECDDTVSTPFRHCFDTVSTLYETRASRNFYLGDFGTSSLFPLPCSPISLQSATIQIDPAAWLYEIFDKQFRSGQGISLTIIKK